MSIQPGVASVVLRMLVCTTPQTVGMHVVFKQKHEGIDKHKSTDHAGVVEPALGQPCLSGEGLAKLSAAGLGDALCMGVCFIQMDVFMLHAQVTVRIGRCRQAH